MSNPYQRVLKAGAITFPNGSTWVLGEQLSSEEVQDGEYPYEMRVVYSCTKVTCAEKMTAKLAQKGHRVDFEDSIYYKDSKSSGSNTDGRPAKFYHEHTRNEIAALRQLTEASCQSTPRLLDVKEEKQNEGDEFPGAYVVYILMTFLNGKPPYDFGKLAREEKARIQKAFKEAIREVYRCRVMPKDEAIRNILWDEESDISDRCFIIDFEHIVFRSKITEKTELWSVDDELLTSWSLAEYSGHGVDLHGDGSCLYIPPRYARQNHFSVASNHISQDTSEEPPQLAQPQSPKPIIKLRRERLGDKVSINFWLGSGRVLEVDC